MSLPRILLTGGSGFIGTHLIPSLLLEPCIVYVLSRSPSSFPSSPFLISVSGDLSLSSLLSACVNIDTVFHLAAKIGYTEEEREEMEKVNVDGTRNVMEACKRTNVRRVIYCSSIVTIGANGKQTEQWRTEESEYNMGIWKWGYFETKWKAEKIVKEYAKNGLDVVILNLGNVYGYGDAVKSSRKTQWKAAQGKMPFYTEGGVNIVAIDDVVRAFLKAWKIGKSGERYIIGGENITVYQLLCLFSEAAGNAKPFIPLPSFLLSFAADIGLAQQEKIKAAQMYHWYDCSKANRELGLQPTSARDAIKESVRFMKEKGMLKSSQKGGSFMFYVVIFLTLVICFTIFKWFRLG